MPLLVYNEGAPACRAQQMVLRTETAGPDRRKTKRLNHSARSVLAGLGAVLYLPASCSQNEIYRHPPAKKSIVSEVKHAPRTTNQLHVSG